jgi:hypothetical protein
MKIELVKATRPELPKYFPPGYCDRMFWVMIVSNLFCPIWCGTWAYINARDGNTIGLWVQCAILSLGILSTARVVRIILRHSREWRTEERPRTQAWIDEHEKHMQQMAEEFAEFLNKRDGGKNEH